MEKKNLIRKMLGIALIAGSLSVSGCEKKRPEPVRNVYSVHGRTIEHLVNRRMFKDCSTGKQYHANEQGNLHAVLLPDTSIIQGYTVKVSPHIQGVFSELPDPYVTFMTSEEEKEFHSNYMAILEGIAK